MNHTWYRRVLMLLLVLMCYLNLMQLPASATNIMNTDFEDFTATNWQGWTADNGIWEIGTPTSGPNSAHDGTKCAATVLDGNYPEGQSSRLISPAMNLPDLSSGQAITLKFWQWFNWGFGSSGVVQVQEWSGTAWSNWVTVSNRYDSICEAWKCTGRDFSPVDLSAYAGKRIRIGFLHDANYVSTGWYLDSVRVDVEAIGEDMPLNQTISFEEFSETDWQGWHANLGIWGIGTPTSGPNSAHDGTKCAATVLDGNYPERQSSRLVSPAMNLPNLSSGQAITLKFWQWFNWGFGSSGVVQVQEWSGTAWVDWVTVSDRYESICEAWKCAGRDFSPVDLSAYAGKRIRIGFLHDANYVSSGWYLDSVRVDVEAIGEDMPLNQTISFEEFSETDWHGWHADLSIWEIGTPTSGPNSAHDGTKCAATVLDGDYPYRQSSRLISPAMNLPDLSSGQAITLKFWQWFNWGFGSSGVVQVLEWSGTAWGNWVTVSDRYEGYSEVWKYAGSDFSAVDLSAYAGKRIRIGFLHDANYVSTGWYLDDITVILPPPTISSFTPSFGKIGDSVTITGTNFTGTTAVKFNGTAVVTYTVVSATSITATIPSGATTGKIMVTTPGGTATSATDYTVYFLPTITSFTPSFGKVGDSVTITGTNFVGTSGVKFNGTAVVTYTVVSATSITATVPSGATTGKITVTTPGGTATSATDYTVYFLPTITSFTPTFGKVGDSVTITGTNFIGTTGVKFNGTAVVTYTVVSATSITATVPSGATSGKITVTTPGGTATSATDYTVYFLPTISSFTPTFGKVGDSMTITGTNFVGTTGVKFNGTTVVTFTVVSDTSITATVPSGATTGKITVTTPGGTATSATDYTVYFLPTITSFAPAFGKVGDSVTITGTNFVGTTGVKFNGTAVVTYTVVSATSITATVPSGATTGKITVTTPGGTATSATNYTVYLLPTISSFTPSFGKVGDSVTITGTNFVGTSGVKFNGTAVVTYTVVSATSITTTVPSGATTGKITVTTPGGTAISASDYTVYQPTSLVVTINPGAGYIAPISGIMLNYSLVGVQTYTGTLALDNSGKATIAGLQPGIYTLSITGSHWLKRTVTSINVDGVNGVSTHLTDGDADGGNSINLFDFVVLDANFGSSDAMADLDGSGQVNLFDYVIIDQNFGALGDADVNMKVNPIDGAEMVWVPAGEFLMGSNSPVGYSNEWPQRQVHLDGYWIYKDEVTVAQYRAFCLATSRSMPDAPSWGWQETNPIVNVNWQDAAAYASWAGVSLPTEAQWEKAARGTDGRIYPWGSLWDESKFANASNSYGGTKPVGSYPTGASPYGCMDMVGNAWEWCTDWYNDNYYQTAPSINPLGPLNGSTRVLRGGSWDYNFDDSSRCAYRGYPDPSYRDFTIGFRCALGDGDGKLKVNPIDGAEMVWVSAGEFLMGSDTDWPSASPKRSVYLDGYWMYKYEVTVAQYRAFCQDTNRSMPDAPSWGWQDTHPVLNVSWLDAVAYASWAGVSLPTEAQWEKAARGTDARVFPWGNLWDTSKCANYSNSSSGTKPVGSYPSGVSPYGCMDMAGNVWEWCADWYDATYYLTGPNNNPLGPASGTDRINRGGMWACGVDDYFHDYFRCVFRGRTVPSSRASGLGFRCAKN